MLTNRFRTVAVLLVFALPAAAQKNIPPVKDSKALAVSSDAVGAMVLDKKIKLMLRDGTFVEGKVFRATQDTVTMKVSKSEPKNRISGPEAAIATADIGAVYMDKNGTVAAPIALGVVCGWLGGAAAAYAFDGMHSNGAYLGLIVLGMTGGATGGSFAGREASRKTVMINVLPARKP